MKYSILKKEDTKLITQLVALINKSYASNGEGRSWTSEEGYFNGARTSNNQVLGQLKSDTAQMFVGFLKDQLVACVYIDRNEIEGYIGMLSVDVNQQAKGYGREMLMVAENHLKEEGIKLIKIKVIKTRNDLLDWYVRLGYKYTGEEVEFEVVDKSIGIPVKEVVFKVLEKAI